MNIVNVFSLLGGLALFLYGVNLMGDSLNIVAGNKLQVALYRMTSNPIKGILLGIGVTALIQSSTATSVMAIGFVNSGLMEFSQAVSIILGSIVGTSVTGWIACLSTLGQGGGWTSMLSTMFVTGVFATVGIILLKFSKNPTKNRVGSILLGFSVLMFGMTAMSDAVSPLRESESFIELLTRFENPFLGVFVGIVFTAIIRSSAAAVGILQALSMTGVLTFSAAYPIILGIAVGGAAPVLISALDASLNARRTALVHLVIVVSGALFCGVVNFTAQSQRGETPTEIFHRREGFTTIVILTPAIGLLERIACLVIKDEPRSDENSDWDLLEDRFIQHPALAIEQCRIVSNSMAKHVQANITDALALLHDYSDAGFDRIQDTEELVDQYEDKLGTYIVQITTAELTQQQNEDVYQFLHAITDLERISDHASNIAENAKEISTKSIPLSDDLLSEMSVMENALSEVVSTSIHALTEHDREAALRVEPLEERIDELCAEMKHRCIDRMTKGVYTRQNSFVFNDLIGNFERVSDHCSNIAIAMIELENDAFDMHNYLEDLMNRKDEVFEKYYEIYQKKYTFD